jgi:hypothetical protein
MAGHLGQIYNIVKTGKVSDKSFEPVMWVLAISAFSLILPDYCGCNVCKQWA